MNKIVKKLSTFFASVMMTIMFTGIMTQAADTVFMYPNFTDPNPPAEMFYYNGKNIEIYKGAYGINADMDNTEGIGAGIAEISAHVNEESGSHYVIGIYTNGDDFSADNINAIVADGWYKLEAYYYDYFVSVFPAQTSESFAPRIKVSENDAAKQILANAGYENEVAMIDVNGINQPFFSIIYYQPDFSFLMAEGAYCYKYMSSIGYFVNVNTDVYFYDGGFLDICGLDSIDSSADGTFVVVNSPLPEGIVASADNWMNMEPIVPKDEDEKGSETDSEIPDNSDETSGDENVSSEDETIEIIPQGNETIVDKNNQDIIVNDTVSAEEIEKYIENNNTLLVQNKEKNVEWKIDKVEHNVDFITTATVDSINETDYIVEFGHSGNLPGEAQVTISLPDTKHSYINGDTLYLYYVNSETGKNELASTGIYENGKVTFTMTHCSKYIITSEDRGQEYSENNKKVPVCLIVSIIVGLVVAATVVFLVLKKKSKRKADIRE